MIELNANENEEYEIFKRETLLDKLRKLWNRAPFIDGGRNGPGEEVVEEVVELCFADNKRVCLQNSGSVYDYIVLARERYVSDITADQVREIIQKEKRDPLEVTYYVQVGDTRKDEITIPYIKMREQYGWN